MKKNESSMDKGKSIDAVRLKSASRIAAGLKDLRDTQKTGGTNAVSDSVRPQNKGGQE